MKVNWQCCAICGCPPQVVSTTKTILVYYSCPGCDGAFGPDHKLSKHSGPETQDRETGLKLGELAWVQAAQKWRNITNDHRAKIKSLVE